MGLLSEKPVCYLCAKQPPAPWAPHPGILCVEEHGIRAKINATFRLGTGSFGYARSCN